MIKSKCFLLFLVTFSFVEIVIGQPLNVTRYSEQDGLTAATINEITQDSLGFIWLATNDGLFCYNGKKFESIKAGNFSFASRLKNRILFGDHFLNSISYNPISGSDEKPLTVQSKLSFTANRFLQFSDGEFWWADQDAIYQFTNNRLLKHDLPDIKISGENWLLASNENKELWAMTTSGLLFKWRPLEKRFQAITYTSPFRKVTKLIINSSDDLFVGTEKGLAEIKIRIDLGATARILYEDSLIHDVIKDKFGNFWIGSSDRGVVKGNFINDSLVFRRIIDGSEPHRLSYLPFKSARKIFLDHSKNLWVAHEAGLSMLSGKPFVNLAPSLPNEVVRSLAFMKDGRTYVSGIGTFFVGKKMGHYEYDLSPVELSPNLYPNAICECNNRLWIGATDNNLYYLENGKLSKPINLKSRGGNIFYLFCDHAGEVWVSQAQVFNPIIGILKVMPDLSVVDYNQRNGFSTRMLVTRQAPYGTIYCAGIGDSTYLYRFDEVNNRFENLSLPMPFDYGENFEVHDIAIGADSTVWMASTAGLLRYKNKKIEQIQFEEFYGHEVVAVNLTKDNVLWASTEENGLVRLEKDGTYAVFDEKAGLPSNIMWYRSLYIDSEGKVWAGSREGLAVSSQAFPSARLTGTPIFISRSVNGKAVATSASFDFHSTLALDFVSLDYPTRNIVYQYKFEGKKEEWHDVHSQPLKLEELESGNYAIALRARQNDGSAWSLPLIYQFTINQPWYKSNPAIAFYILTVVAVIVMSVKIYNRSLIEEKKLLESKVKERTRELSLKTDEVLAQNEELKQLSDELHAQNDSVIEQKLLIEKQNYLLSQSKLELEQKVEERTLELKLSNEEMAQQNVQLEQFAFMTAHNLRAPVARLLGLGSLLDSKKIADPFTLEVVNRMIRSSEDLDETIREISTILHIKSGVHGIFADINLKKIFDNVIGSFQEEINASGVIIASELSNKHVINGVEAYVHSIFYNIVSNSLKYADEHRALQIRVTVHELNDHLGLIFSDNGIGFDSKMVQEKIFKPFARFNTMREGRGLGLYMMKIQMDMMNGCISIESKLNEGTSVTLTFAK